MKRLRDWLRERREDRDAKEAVARLLELARREASGHTADALRRGSYDDELEAFRIRFHQMGLTDSRGRLGLGDRLAIRVLLFFERAAELRELRRSRR